MIKGINFCAPINQLGYGIAALNVVKAAELEGLPLALFPIGQPQEVPTEDQQTVQDAMRRGQLWDKDAPSVRMYHQFDLAMHCGTPRVGFPFFELDTFTSVEKHHLNQQDMLLVASSWAKEVIEANGINVQTHVVPLGVDKTIFYPEANALTSDETVFFNVGKWEIRKGHDVIIEAFEKAFSPDSNVKLIMACNNPFLQPHEQGEWESRYKNSKLGSKVEIVNKRFKTQKELARLMNLCDVGVFPARAEGWNLDMLEAMACGKHIITTNNTAHTEFCSKCNASMVEVTEIEPAYDGKWFFEQGNWGKLGQSQINQIAEYMLEFHELKQAGKLSTNLSGLDTADLFSWRNTVKIMWSRFYG